MEIPIYIDLTLLKEFATFFNLNSIQNSYLKRWKFPRSFCSWITLLSKLKKLYFLQLSRSQSQWNEIIINNLSTLFCEFLCQTCDLDTFQFVLIFHTNFTYFLLSSLPITKKKWQKFKKVIGVEEDRGKL